MVGPDGEYRRAFGGRGDGPGEFRHAAEFAVMRDGSVVVSDWGYSAYQVFDASGAYERRISWAQPWAVAVSAGLMPDPDGGGLFVAAGAPIRALEMVNWLHDVVHDAACGRLNLPAIGHQGYGCEGCCQGRRPREHQTGWGGWDGIAPVDVSAT